MLLWIPLYAIYVCTQNISNNFQTITHIIAITSKNKQSWNTWAATFIGSDGSES